MAEQASRGVVNAVTEVRLEQGDLAEAWAEPGREYATVAMRFSMIDVTRDQAGRVVEKASTPAKLTQARYGNSRAAAIGEIVRKAAMVRTIASHIATISTKAAPGRSMPKNTKDHSVFSAS